MKQLKQKQKAIIIKSIRICVIFCLTSVLQEYIIQHYYINSSNNYVDHLRIPSTFVLVPSAIGWLLSSILIYNKSQQAVYIPSRKLILCGITMAAGSLAFNLIIYLLNFPFAMMMRGFNILPIFLSKYFISNGENQKKYNRLIPKILFAGLMMFYLGKGSDIYTKIFYHQKILKWFFVFFISDTIFPIIQSNIITKHQPTPLRMMQVINKWCTVVTLAYILFNNQLNEIVYFLYFNIECFFHLIVVGCLSSVGQFYVIDILYNTQRPYVNFLISFRKVVTVIFSLLLFDHKLKIIQLVGVGVTTLALIQGLKSEFIQNNEKQKIYQTQTSGQMDSIIQNDQEKI